MLDFLNNYTDILITWFGIVISIYLIYYGYKFQASKKPLEKQLNNVYLPMYRLVEKYEGKNAYLLDLNEIKSFSRAIYQIIDTDYELVEPRIIYWNKELMRLLLNAKDIDSDINFHFVTVCRQIEIHFERTRRKLYLPSKGLFFKWTTKYYNFYVDVILKEGYRIIHNVILLTLLVLLISIMIINR